MPPAIAGWQQQAGKTQPTATDTIHRTVSRLFFFLSPYLWRENNQATPACWKTYWNCIVFELCGVFLFFVFCFFVCADLFYFMRPLWWDNYKTTSEEPSPGLENETDTKIIKTETSLHLNLQGFVYFFNFLFSIFHFVLFYLYIYIIFIYLFFVFILIFILFIFYFQSSFCLSKACSAYCRLVH
jgi:hypothetical protein